MLRTPTRLESFASFLRLSRLRVRFCSKLSKASVTFNVAAKVFDEMPLRSLPSWNKIYNRFQADHNNDYNKNLKVNTFPDETEFVALLKSFGSTSHVGLSYIEQIHARIIRSGFENSPLVCNLVIDWYLKKGYVVSGRKVFRNLNSRDSVSTVAMISGLSKNGYEEEAVLLFREMNRSSHNSLTPYIFSSVLSACTKIGLFKIGLQIHSLALRTGFSSETYVCNALVTLYSRSGNLISAEGIFSSMQNRDRISYNTLISGLSQRGYSNKALGLFKKMQFDCLKPDCVTVASLLSACAAVGGLVKGKQLHSYALKSGMTCDIILEGSLLDLYVKCSDLKTAHEFFLTTERENAVLWNVMLVAYGQYDDLIGAFRIYKQMLIEGVIPNDFTYPSVLRTCTSVGELGLGEQIHTQSIKSGFQCNAYVCSVLIDMYAKNGRLEIALGILRRLEEADVVCWTSMVAGYMRHGFFSEALRLFEEMEIRGIRADNIGFASAITACAGIKALEQGKQVHAQSYVSGFSKDFSVGNALVSLYSRCGQISDSYRAFEKNEAKDIVAWNSLISGFAQSGHYEEALSVYSEMNTNGIEANQFTFGSAVSAAANSGNVKQGQEIHAMVLKTGHGSETEASNSLITLYAKCGRIEDAKREFYEEPEKNNEVSWNAMITACSQHGFGLEAVELFKDMKRLGFTPSHITFVAVLSACSHVGLVNEGLKYFESMRKDHRLEQKPEHYVCIVDLYGRAGLLREAKGFIEKMPIKPDAMIWRTLLSSCTVHGDAEIGEFATKHLLYLEPDDSATYVLSSNMYAVTGNWDFQDQTRKLMKNFGVKKEPGRSLMA